MSKNKEEALQLRIMGEMMNRVYFIYYWRKFKSETSAKIGLLGLFFLWTYFLAYGVSIPNILKNALEAGAGGALDFTLSLLWNVDFSIKVMGIVTAVFLAIFSRYVKIFLVRFKKEFIAFERSLYLSPRTQNTGTRV